MAADVDAIEKILVEMTGTARPDFFSTLTWLCNSCMSHNSSEKIHIGSRNGKAVFADHNSRNKAIGFHQSDYPYELYWQQILAIDFHEPFNSIGNDSLERRNTLRIILQACFVLRGHSAEEPFEMTNKILAQFRRGINLLMKKSNAAGSSSLPTSPEDRHLGLEDSPTKQSTVARPRTVLAVRLPCAAQTAPSPQQPYALSAQIELPPQSATGTLSPAPPPKMSSSRASSKSSNSSQAREEHRLPSDDAETYRLWKSNNKRHRNESVTPVKKPYGMFDSPDISPSQPRAERMESLPKTSVVTPRKRTYGMFGGDDNVDSESPQLSQVSPMAAKQARAPTVKPKRRSRSRLFGSTDSSTVDLTADESALSQISLAKGSGKRNAAKFILGVVAKAQEEHDTHMLEMFDGNGEMTTDDNGDDTGQQTDDRISTPAVSNSTEPKYDSDSLFVSPQQPSSQSNSNRECYDGLSPQRKSQVKEYLRLKRVTETVDTAIATHRARIVGYDSACETSTLGIDSLTKQLRIEQYDIVNKGKEAMRKLEQEIQTNLAACKVKINAREAQYQDDIGKFTAGKVSEQAMIEKVSQSAEEAKKKMNQLEKTGGFRFGADVNEVTNRKRQRRA